MIRITKNEGNTIFYSCDCGTYGKCMIKPLGKSDTLITKLSCALCGQTEKLVFIQYKTELEKKQLMSNIDEADLSWSLVLSNEILE